MPVKTLLKAFLKHRALRSLDHYYSNTRLMASDLRMLRLLDIAANGQDADGTPYIRLGNGEVFYSFLPTQEERRLYHTYKMNLPGHLNEDCFRVALDVVQRFYRENSWDYVPPKTHHLYPGWGFVDLGSYVGFGAMKAARKVGDTGVVVAVEASPEAYRVLVKNVTENKLSNVYTIHAAVQDKNGTIPFYTGEQQDNSIYQSVDDQVYTSGDQRRKAVTVPAETVDAILEQIQYPVERFNTFMSFEINGAEPEALLGMTRFLNTSPRFDLRIAARYGQVNSANTRDKIMEILSTYPGIHIIDLEPYIYAYKYPVQA